MNTSIVSAVIALAIPLAATSAAALPAPDPEPYAEYVENGLVPYAASWVPPLPDPLALIPEPVRPYLDYADPYVAYAEDIIVPYVESAAPIVLGLVPPVGPPDVPDAESMLPEEARPAVDTAREYVAYAEGALLPYVQSIAPGLGALPGLDAPDVPDVPDVPDPTPLVPAEPSGELGPTLDYVGTVADYGRTTLVGYVELATDAVPDASSLPPLDVPDAPDLVGLVPTDVDPFLQYLFGPTFEYADFLRRVAQDEILPIAAGLSGGYVTAVEDLLADAPPPPPPPPAREMVPAEAQFAAQYVDDVVVPYAFGLLP